MSACKVSRKQHFTHSLGLNNHSIDFAVDRPDSTLDSMFTLNPVHLQYEKARKGETSNTAIPDFYIKMHFTRGTEKKQWLQHSS